MLLLFLSCALCWPSALAQVQTLASDPEQAEAEQADPRSSLHGTFTGYVNAVSDEDYI